MIGIAVDPALAPALLAPSVATQAMLWVPSASTKVLGLLAVFRTCVEPLSVQVMFVTLDESLAETWTSTPFVPLVAMLYQPLPATVSTASVVIVTTGGVESAAPRV